MTQLTNELACWRVDVMTDEETDLNQDRYTLEPGYGGYQILDRAGLGRRVAWYPGDEWVGAWRHLAVLNRRAATGLDPLSEPETPQEFLTHTLPAKAREQRSESLSRLLSEAWDVVDRSLKLIQQDTEIMNRASGVIRRIQEELAALEAPGIEHRQQLADQSREAASELISSAARQEGYDPR